MTDPTAPQLTDNYSKCRTITVTAAAFIFLGLYSPITLPETIPVIGVSITDKSLALLALALVAAYQLLRMVVEWYNSSLVRRKSIASKIDFTVALLISASALILWGFHYFQLEIPDDFSYTLAFLLTMYSIIMGGCFTTMMFAANFVRTKAEALRSGLPRIPVATRGAFLLAGIFLSLLIPIYIASLFFSATMQHSWLIFSVMPAVLMVFTEILSCLSKQVRLQDGSFRLRKEHIQHLQKAFDTHDSQYQIGGWVPLAKAKPSSFYSACEKGDLQVIEKLLSQGASPDEKGQLGWTPLMIATAQGHEAAVHILLEAGANPNVFNNHGRTPLMFASRYGNRDLVSLLLAAKADPSLKAEPETGGPIMTAAAFGHTLIVASLLDAGANVNVCDRQGRTVVEIAEQAGYGETATLLRKWMRTSEKN